MPEASGSDVADESDYSIFENKSGLAEDMKFLASMPELCDVTFLVGDTKEPICAVKAVLAARSRVFQKMFYQAPSPQRKKDPPPKENKIRLFLKRSSEPLLNMQNAAQQPNQHHTVIIEEFEPDVFRQLIEYIHTGCVTLQPRTLLGLMNAADYYGLEQLRKACTGFVQCCITVDTVCALLASAERYIQYKCTKSLVHKVFEFVDEHGNEVLNLGSFTLLPQHVVRLILAREELRADEFTKFQAALMWSKKYCDSNQNQDLKEVIGNFLEYIQFHKIPANVLMREVHPLGLVPSSIIVNALAYQADPTSVDPGKLSPHRVKHQDRSLSVQSSLQDQYGSNTSLSSTGSDEGSDEKQHSGKYGIAEQEIREREQWPKHRHSEEEDIQRLIEQRSQYQSMRQEDSLQQQQDEQLIRKQEEELRRQELQEEFERRQKELLRKKQQEELRRKKEEEESSRKQKEAEDAARRQKEQEIDRQRLDEEKRKEEGERPLERRETQMETQNEEDKEPAESIPSSKGQEEKSQQPLEEEKRTEQKEEEEEEKQKSETAELKRRKEEEQRRIREKRKLQLPLEELKSEWALRQDLLLQKQEESLERQIEEMNREEQWESSRQFQQTQVYLEGRKPSDETEKRSEEGKQRQTTERKKVKQRRREERVEIRVHGAESPKQEQQSADGVTGFYIKLVVRQEGRPNLVWLFKTHIF
ncbi:unnamed protein product [Heterotrigona itama]|uniref:BTB domain-containing protein n=1 Tax=Heterotrigona itama TaxID=395501 RepID=A0A6V7HGU6_9HYME|nr:unnamed protein product [Heterotrigona itama]